MLRWHNTIRAAALLALLPAACDRAGPAAPDTIVPSLEVSRIANDPPFYARVERPFSYHSDQWAAIVFYRPPSCVPADFNLLDLFDIPAAFDCTPMTTDGWEMRKDLGDPFAAPFQSVIQGLGAVPIWLVSWSDMQTALADDVVTKAELQSLPSLLIGTAYAYEEMLQPIPTRVPSRVVINAQGTVADGRRFMYHYNSHDDFSGNDVRSVRIDIW